jgi:hypothetical protein
MTSENIVALCDVDWQYAAGVFKKYPQAKRYKDFREMLDEQDDIDAVVIAAHADEAFRMLADPSPDEARLLGAWSYSENRTVLHRDTTWLPSNRRAWASWNYRHEPSVPRRSPPRSLRRLFRRGRSTASNQRRRTAGTSE